MQDIQWIQCSQRKEIQSLGRMSAAQYILCCTRFIMTTALLDIYQTKSLCFGHRSRSWFLIPGIQNKNRDVIYSWTCICCFHCFTAFCVHLQCLFEVKPAKEACPMSLCQLHKQLPPRLVINTMNTRGSVSSLSHSLFGYATYNICHWRLLIDQAGLIVYLLLIHFCSGPHPRLNS